MKEQEEKNIKKSCFRFYLWPDEITEQFPSHDTDGRKRGKKNHEAEIICRHELTARGPRLINHRSRSTLRSLQQRGRRIWRPSRRNSHGVPRDSAGRKQAGIISSWSRDRIDFSIVFAWPAITGRELRGSGWQAGPRRLRARQERKEEGPRGDRWGGEGGGNRLAVYLNLNIMQID